MALIWRMMDEVNMVPWSKTRSRIECACLCANWFNCTRIWFSSADGICNQRWYGPKILSSYLANTMNTSVQISAHFGIFAWCIAGFMKRFCLSHAPSYTNWRIVRYLSDALRGLWNDFVCLTYLLYTKWHIMRYLSDVLQGLWNSSVCLAHLLLLNGALWDICPMHCGVYETVLFVSCTFCIQNGALWDICPMHCAISEMVLFVSRPFCVHTMSIKYTCRQNNYNVTYYYSYYN